METEQNRFYTVLQLISSIISYFHHTGIIHFISISEEKHNKVHTLIFLFITLKKKNYTITIEMTDSAWILHFQLFLSHILPHRLQSSESTQAFLLLPKLALHPELVQLIACFEQRGTLCAKNLRICSLICIEQLEVMCPSSASDPS